MKNLGWLLGGLLGLIYRLIVFVLFGRWIPFEPTAPAKKRKPAPARRQAAARPTFVYEQRKPAQGGPAPAQSKRERAGLPKGPAPTKKDARTLAARLRDPKVLRESVLLGALFTRRDSRS